MNKIYYWYITYDPYNIRFNFELPLIHQVVFKSGVAHSSKFWKDWWYTSLPWVHEMKFILWTPDSKKLVLLQHKSNTHIFHSQGTKKENSNWPFKSHKFSQLMPFFFHHLLYIRSLESFIDYYHTYKQGEKLGKKNTHTN